MSKSPLMQAVRRLLRTAHRMNQLEGVPNDERLDYLLAKRASRRRVLRGGAQAASLLAVGSLLPGCQLFGSRTPAPPTAAPETGPRIAIVGAGIAGLTCAHYLAELGLSARLYDSSARTGGRILTTRNGTLPGVSQELGAEFIDSNNAEMMELVEAYGLALDDRFAGEVARDFDTTYFFNGVHHRGLDLLQDFRPLAARINADYDRLGDIIDFENEGNARDLDQLSIAQYLDRIGASGVVRQLIEVAFVIQNGMETDRQSALNLIIVIDEGNEEVALFGESDERFRIVGGNQRLTDAMGDRFASFISQNLLLESIRETGTGRYRLSFLRSNGTAVEEEADFVVLTLPFTMLREVRMNVEMPDIKRRVIRDLAYGMNSKLLLRFDQRVWERQQRNGDGYTDLPIQAFWNNANNTAGPGAGSLTIFTGGDTAVGVTRMNLAQEIQWGIGSLDRIMPGLEAASSNRGTRLHWPTQPHVRASYSGLGVGQWTTLLGAAEIPVGNLYFAGEHCGGDFQGYMNGAALSGRVAAEAIAVSVMG